ncbi:pilus assembly protein TadG [Enterovibrio norvegicus FF-33]|uniref:Pilus assembly protein TadG n=1 Tax=Enterovibrio norvegicus FF-454 TaxID=1185651 RepID=A0A1E5C5M4_9GAMM|nr:TadE/TadG family type IV pilus assembly protein [Enterovibrio norvegicus]OEE60831.1 pilus assembly protein TadG [Enterovibrio norvegicus FF-454]OEE67398.1 pilus assembly protein TadG [Enterovibrio norvegicus FF-33]OEE74554.1 pilus assembly protein TadG [Enterovibrio norvegicus FF-162]
MQVSLPSHQRGIASIIFVIIFPLLFSVFALAVESTRYLQTHARIGDSVEVASLAVAANATFDTTTNQELAKGIVDAYVPDGEITLSDINIVRKSCDQIYGSNCGKPGIYDKEGLVFTEYRVTLSSEFESWYPEDDYAAGYEETLVLEGSAVARKYQGFTIDVAFVADFSGSMLDSWNGDTKYLGVIKVISDITQKLEAFNESTELELNGQRILNRVSLIGYNMYPHDGSRYYSNVDYYGNYSSLTWEWWKNIPNINFNATVSDPLNNKRTSITGRYAQDYSSFRTLDLTEDFPSFRSTISRFYPSYGTASYEGIIEAGKIVNRGKNVRKLIIVLSDGEDSPNQNNSSDNRYPGYAALQLYNRGLCDNILSSLESNNIEGRQVEAKIFVIGFGYDIDKNPGLKICAGEDNIQSADSYQEIYDTVLELISEEVGHLYFRHYDQ